MTLKTTTKSTNKNLSKRKGEITATNDRNN